MSESFPFEIETIASFKGLRRPLTVEAYATEIDFVVAHDSFLDGWCLTHGPTGCNFARNLPSLAVARSMAFLIANRIDLDLLREVVKPCGDEIREICDLPEAVQKLVADLDAIRVQLCPEPSKEGGEQ